MKGGGKMTLQEKLLNFRMKKNITQQQLANMCGLSLITINLIEAGKKKKINKMTEYKLRLFFEREGE